MTTPRLLGRTEHRLPIPVSVITASPLSVLHIPCLAQPPTAPVKCSVGSSDTVDPSQEQFRGGRANPATHSAETLDHQFRCSQHYFHVVKDNTDCCSDHESKTGFKIKVYLHFVPRPPCPAAHCLLRKTRLLLFICSECSWGGGMPWAASGGLGAASRMLPLQSPLPLHC